MTDAESPGRTLQHDTRGQYATFMFLFLGPVVFGMMTGIFVSAYLYPLTELQYLLYSFAWSPIAFGVASLWFRYDSWRMEEVA